ncbi:MAG: division/cell wall cluster transcriptional repressor MraZ [Pseudomonadota bacterium]
MATRGIYNINMDAKGRMALPAKLRAHLPNDGAGLLVCTIDVQSRCLVIYPEDEWSSVEEQLQSLPSLDIKSRRFKRLILGHASDLEPDSNGRVLIPSVLREFASLDKKIVVLGQAKKIEVWDETAWVKERELALDEVADDFEELSESMMSLSI